jgi:glycosyltransferase involved in cell wall biosynthesis
MDGIGWFTYNTMKYITINNPDIEFHFLFDSGINKEFLFSKNIVGHNLFPPAKHALLNIAWFEWSVRSYLKKVNPDLFLSPDGILCLGWNGKQYGIIHDINFVHIPEDLKWANRKYYNYYFPRYAGIASRLATVSEYSKKDIVNTFGTDPGKIDVVYCGINEFYEPVSDQIKAQVKQKYCRGAEFFVFVGTLHPRKNITRLLHAFEKFKQAFPSDAKLLLVGREMYRTNEMHQYRNSMHFKDDVIFAGPLPADELKIVFASALCLTFVPYFEGFGIPAIEAMQCDVPVIAANATSVPEVVGDAALLVDPYNVHDIALAMQRVWQQPLLRQELINKGRERKLVFPWERTAKLLWDGVSKVL